MKILLLGSAIGSGFPAWNDGGPLARRARDGDGLVPRRKGLSLAVSADGVRYSIVDAPLHLPETLSLEPRFAPAEGTRSVPLDTLVLTGGELDACAGALGFARALSVRVASPHALRDALIDHDAAFRALAPSWSGHAFDRPFPLDRNDLLEARFFPLPGPTPTALRELAPQAGRARAGVRITDRRTGARLVFAPRVARFDGATVAELRAADVRLVDGTFFEDAEGRLHDPAVQSARELGHAPIDGRDGSLVWLAGMPGRSLYVHLAGTNPACDAGSKAWTRIHEAGVEVARDGLELET